MSNNFLDKDGAVVGPMDFNLTLGRKAAASCRALVLSTEDLAAINAIATAIAGTLTVTATQSGTWNINNISGTISLPTGAATAANQATANASLATIASAAADTTTPSPVKIDQTTPGTTNGVVSTPATTAYALIAAPSTYRLLSAAATTNGANIKGSAGAVKGIQGYNAKASAVYLKLYNKATSPTVGTDVPVKTIYLPATAAFALDFGTGVGFTTGISIALTGAGADADTTALSSGDVLALNVDYH